MTQRMTRRGLAGFDPLIVAQRPTLDTALAQLLADRIGRAGPISFAEWMRACLYHPLHGYYRRGAATVGRDGDFLTGPEVHPIFGAAIAHVASALWRQADRPQPFNVVEVGPGTGALAESILRHWHAQTPELASISRYTLVEPDPVPAAQQRTRLSPIHDVSRLHHAADIAEAPSDAHLVVANELLDALPVHRLVLRAGRWLETLVDHTPAGGFEYAYAEVTDPAVLRPLAGVAAQEGQIAEVAPERGAVVGALADLLSDGGLLLLFDYGYERSRLYAPWRRDGTLMTFHRHTPGDDPLDRPGERDITCHIDIEQVGEAAGAAGLSPLPVMSQAEWLHRLGAAVLPGVADATTSSVADAKRSSVADATSYTDYLSARRAVETLTDPAGLGRIAVMGFRRGATEPLPGWATNAGLGDR